MTDDARKKRLVELSKIPAFARMDHRFYKNEKGEIPHLTNLPRRERRKSAAQAKKIVLQYGKHLQSLHSSGAGFPVDRFLREMAIEYTHRYAASGVHNQPMSFNYFEPFCNIKLLEGSVAPYADLMPEVDHLFNATDFFDYITSTDGEAFQLDTLLSLPERKAFHFSTNGDIRDLHFLSADKNEFVISGFSMLRRENSLFWYLIGGEFLSEADWCAKTNNQTSMKIEDVTPWKRHFIADVLENNGDKKGHPQPLEGTDRAHRTIVAGEIDIRTGKHLARCHLSEYQHTFDVICDDPEILRDIRDKEELAAVQLKVVSQLNQASVLWSLADGLIQLPHYFSLRLAINKLTLKQTGKRLIGKKSGQGLLGRYEVVSAIEVIDEKDTQAICMLLTCPPFMVQRQVESEVRIQRDCPSGKRPTERPSRV